MGIKEHFYTIAAMAMMSGALPGGSNYYPYRVEKMYKHFRCKRENETEEEYDAAWHEHRKQRIADDCAKKGLTVFEINGELIPARNEREAQKRYKHRHK